LADGTREGFGGTIEHVLRVKTIIATTTQSLKLRAVSPG